MNRVDRAVRKLDRLQQRHAWLGFPVAVWKKFGDDQAGNLAALIAYFGFAALFPLLLVFVTVLDIVLHNAPALREQVISSTIGNFPGFRSELQVVAHRPLTTTGPALVIGLVLTFLGARGVAGAVQNALSKIWSVPFYRRPGFPWSLLRGLAMIIVVGLGLIGTSVLAGLAAGVGHVINGGGSIGTVAVSLLVNIGVFWLAFRLGTAREVTWRDHFPGALASAVVWQALQLAGGYIVGHQLAHNQSLYGIFGVVLGLLAWLYLQAQATLYAVEATVVRARKLWPRSLAQPLTAADRRAYALYASTTQRNADERIRIDVDPPVQPPGGEPASGQPTGGQRADAQPTGGQRAGGQPPGGQRAGGQRAG